MRQVILFFLMVVWPVLGFAECSGGFCNDVKIQQMQVNANDAIVWVQTTGTETSLNCEPQSGKWLKLDAGSDGGKNVYAALLSIQARDVVTDVRLQDNVNQCSIAYVVPK